MTRVALLAAATLGLVFATPALSQAIVVPLPGIGFGYHHHWDRDRFDRDHYRWREHRRWEEARRHYAFPAYRW